MTNHTVVTRLDAARNHLDAAQAHAAALRDEYDDPQARRDVGHSARVAAHHNAVRFGLKAAEVSALISLAESARALAGALIDEQQVAELLPALEPAIAEADPDGRAARREAAVRANLLAGQPSTRAALKRIAAATPGRPMTAPTPPAVPLRSLEESVALWRRLLDAAFNHDADAWQLGDGGELLLDVLTSLMHPAPSQGQPAVTDAQLEAALDALEVPR